MASSKIDDLIAASFANHKVFVDEVLDEGLSVNRANKAGDTALMWASKKDENLEMVSYLLARGADTDKQNNDGFTALICAAFKGSVEVAQLLLERGANMELADKDGWTALMWAAIKGHSEVVRLLLQRGANIAVRGKEGGTALSMAKTEEVRKLLEAAIEAQKTAVAEKRARATAKRAAKKAERALAAQLPIAGHIRGREEEEASEVRGAWFKCCRRR